MKFGPSDQELKDLSYHLLGSILDLYQQRGRVYYSLSMACLDMMKYLLHQVGHVEEEILHFVFGQATRNNCMSVAEMILHHAATQYPTGNFVIGDLDNLLSYSVREFLDDRMTNLLLDEGADPNATDQSGLTALTLSRASDPYEIAQRDSIPMNPPPLCH